uniref:C-type lectin domain-containing protein n=1 Tax=Amphilophus citrinellus TaxID=61819 RepID=A0A3Q0S3A4_AMPCI
MTSFDFFFEYSDASNRILFVGAGWDTLLTAVFIIRGNDMIPPEPSENTNPCSVIADKFILIHETKNWEEALNYCRKYHHDLVSITNLIEQELVEEKAKNANTSHVWLGLRYKCVFGLWLWVSDRLVCYENWANETITDQCDLSVAMETGGENKWFKKYDYEEFNFICSLW